MNNWQNVIKDSYWETVEAEEELAEQIEDLIGELQKAISSGRISISKLERVFKKNGVEINVMESFVYSPNRLLGY